MKLYFNQNKDIVEKSHDVVRGGRIEGFDSSYIKILGIFYEFFFTFKFKELILHQEKYKNFVSLESIKKYFKDFEEYFNLDEYYWKKKKLNILLII